MNPVTQQVAGPDRPKLTADPLVVTSHCSPFFYRGKAFAILNNNANTEYHLLPGHAASHESYVNLAACGRMSRDLTYDYHQLGASALPSCPRPRIDAESKLRGFLFLALDPVTMTLRPTIYCGLTAGNAKLNILSSASRQPAQMPRPGIAE